MYKFKSLKDYVYDYIAEEISVENLRPEEKINEASICEKLQVSRTPVREALIQLTADGILRNVPRKGFVVKKISEKEAEELYMIIGNLDGLAAELACPHLTEKDFHDMQFFIDSIDVAINAHNYEMYSAQQKAFHQVYTDKCGNTALIEYLDKMKSKFLKKRYDSESEGDVDEILKITNQEHQTLLDLLKSGKGKDAADFLSGVHWSVNNAHFDRMDTK